MKDKNIILRTVPANLTYLFQPLDVQGGPNGYVKRFMKQKFCDWYAAQIIHALEEGENIEATEVPLKLSIIKPLHAKWFIEMFNHMTNEIGRKVCLKGWEVSGIQGAVDKGMAGLPNLDPFEEIDLKATDLQLNTASIETIRESSKYLNNSPGCYDTDSDEEWVEENEEIEAERNIFDQFDDECDE